MSLLKCLFTFLKIFVHGDGSPPAPGDSAHTMPWHGACCSPSSGKGAQCIAVCAKACAWALWAVAGTRPGVSTWLKNTRAVQPAAGSNAAERRSKPGALRHGCVEWGSCFLDTCRCCIRWSAVLERLHLVPSSLRRDSFVRLFLLINMCMRIFCPLIVMFREAAPRSPVATGPSLAPWPQFLCCWPLRR